MEMTARDVVAMAMKELKVLPTGSEPEADELADGITMLQAMLNSSQTFGNLWRSVTAPVTVPAFTATVDLPEDARTVTAVREIASYERPLTMWERDDYNATPNKAQLGRPLAFVQNRGRDATTLSLWPISPTVFVLAVDYQRRIDVIENPSDNLDVPEEWLETVWTNLAVRMSNMFGSSADLTPELVNRASTLATALRDDDRPDSYSMGAYGYA